jgi:hypothetical protein
MSEPDQPSLALSSVLGDGGSLAGAVPLAPIMAVVGQACAALPGPALTGLEAAVRSAVETALHIDLQDVLTGSWGKVTAVASALRSTRDDLKATALTPLLDHAITSRHNPHIDVTHAGQTLCQLTFEIAVALQLKGVILEISKGRISGARGGHAVAEGTISFLGQSLLKRTSREFALPARLGPASEPAAASR